MESDCYKTFKIPIGKIARDDFDHNKLNKIIRNANILTIHVYQFLRLWILYKYHDNKQIGETINTIIPKTIDKINIPIITTDMINTAYGVLSIKSGNGPKNKNEYKQEFDNFYTKVYSKLGHVKNISSAHMSSIIGYLSTGILTNIENNIKQRFFCYVNKFVNVNFPYDKEKLDIPIKKHRRELYILKLDLQNIPFPFSFGKNKWLT